MKNNTFRQFLNEIPLLSPQQLGIVQQIMTSTLDGTVSDLDLESRIERNFAGHPVCPYCSDTHIQRWGIRAGRQRYGCEECRRLFNAFTGTPLARLRRERTTKAIYQ